MIAWGIVLSFLIPPSFAEVLFHCEEGKSKNSIRNKKITELYIEMDKLHQFNYFGQSRYHKGNLTELRSYQNGVWHEYKSNKYTTINWKSFEENFTKFSAPIYKFLDRVDAKKNLSYNIMIDLDDYTGDPIIKFDADLATDKNKGGEVAYKFYEDHDKLDKKYMVYVPPNHFEVYQVDNKYIEMSPRYNALNRIVKVIKGMNLKYSLDCIRNYKFLGMEKIPSVNILTNPPVELLKTVEQNNIIFESLIRNLLYFYRQYYWDKKNWKNNHKKFKDLIVSQLKKHPFKGNIHSELKLRAEIQRYMLQTTPLYLENINRNVIKVALKDLYDVLKGSY
jgi:hypothetical protein